MIEVLRYNDSMKKEWDDFIKYSDFNSFLLYRDYTEYHKDRFEDASLIIVEKNKIKALLPGNVIGNRYYSHLGLTYGGLITPPNCSFQNTNGYFNLIRRYFLNINISNFTIKIPPYFYSKHQQQNLQYILNTQPNIHIQNQLGSHIYTKNYSLPAKCIRKGKLNDYYFQLTDKIEPFWHILEESLNIHHKSKPVHSLKEISTLKKLFPENILILNILHNTTNELHAGALVFIYEDIAKIQYFAVSENGRKNRASDILYYHIINHFKNLKNYLDFGTNMISNNEINTSLLQTKEKFDISVHNVQTYSLDLKIHDNK